MATLAVEGDSLHVRLSALEKIAAVHGDVIVPLDRVTGVDVVPSGFAAKRGFRSPGSAWPRTWALGTWRYRGGRDFNVIYRNRPAVVVTLRGGPFTRVVVSVDDAEGVAAGIARLVPSPAV